MSGGLAQRAVACKGWRWMPGMLARDNLGQFPYPRRVAESGEPHFGADWSPDLSDPATLGCLLALVLAAHGFDPSMDTWELGEHPDGGGFFTICDRMWTGMEFADALVAALEAAP